MIYQMQEKREAREAGRLRKPGSLRGHRKTPMLLFDIGLNEIKPLLVLVRGSYNKYAVAHHGLNDKAGGLESSGSRG